MGQFSSRSRAAAAAAVPAYSADLRCTPYARPRDAMVWNTDAKQWMRIDLSHELEPTVGWMRDAIRKQLGRDNSHVVRLKLSNRTMLEDDEQLLEYHTIDDYLSFSLINAIESFPMQVLIRMLSGKSVTIDTDAADTVSQLKHKIQEAEGIPADQQKLVFDGRVLEDEERLADVNMPSNSVVHLALRLRGGGSEQCRFVDMSNESGLQRRPWCASAPKWRMASAGLNLEGRCQTRGCAAKGQMVVMPVGYGTFDLLLDANSESPSICPCCKQFVQPITCAFANTEYKWTGIKAAANGKAAQKVQKVDFASVGNEYLRFNDAPVASGGSGIVGWIRLKIQTKMLEHKAGDAAPEVPACSVCLEDMTEGKHESTPCGHAFHSSCLSDWKARALSCNYAVSCPLCRADLEPQQI